MSKHEDLVCCIRGWIRSGRFQSGDKVPSIARLKDEFQVSAGTIRGAMLTLKAERLVEGRQGEGVFVHASAAPETPAGQPNT